MLSDGGITNMTTPVTTDTSTTFSVMSDVCSVGILQALLDISWPFVLYGGLCFMCGVGVGLIISAWFMRRNIALIEEAALRELLRRVKGTTDE